CTRFGVGPPFDYW
nr:immunoglobulin heavy chain junction region [Macaca mulatta]